MDYGILTLIPPIIAIVLAFWLKDLVIAMVAGMIGCSVIMNGTGFIRPLAEQYLMQGIAGNTGIILTIIIFGPFLAAIKKAGGFAAFVEIFNRRVKSPKIAKALTWLISCLMLDQTASTLGAGSVMRPITDEHKVPHEKLGFILSSAGPAMNALIPITIYLIVYSGVIASADPSLNGVNEYIKAIPFNFYAIFSVTLSLLWALEILPDFGPMKQAERRVKETGHLYRPDSNPISAKEIDDMKLQPGMEPDILTFILPFGTFFLSVIVIYLQTKSIQIYTPLFLGFIVSLVYPLLRGYFKLKEITGIVFTGFKGNCTVLIILAFAFGFGVAIKELGFAPYLVSISQGLLSASLLPALAFLISAIVTFATGSLVTGLVILAPIAIPLASSVDANLSMTIAALLGGAMFGDSSSPISTIVVLPSTGANVDVMDLAQAQMPYKLLFSGATLVLYLVAGFLF